MAPSADGESTRLRPALYCDDELDALDAPIFVVEGEKDVETLRAHGFVATTTGGDGSWRPECAKAFAGRDVIMLPDNDDAGRRYRDAIVRDVAPVAASLRVVELPVPEGGDVSDFFAGHYVKDGKRIEFPAGTVEQLDRLVADAPAVARPASRIVITDLHTAEVPGPQEYVVDHLIPAAEQGTGVITSEAAPGGVGKTYLNLLIATQITRGADVFGLKTTQGPVLYLDGESGRSTITRRAAVVARGLGLTAPPQDLWHVYTSTLVDDQIMDEIGTLVERVRPVLVIVDSFNALLSSVGRESTRPEVVNGAYTRLRALGCAVLVADHTPHSTGARPMDSVAKTNDARAAFTIARDGRARVIRRLKLNEGPELPDVRFSMTFTGTDPRTDMQVVFDRLDAEEGWVPTANDYAARIIAGFDTGALADGVSSTDVAGVLGLNANGVKKALQRLRDDGDVVLDGRKWSRKRRRSGSSRIPPDS